MKKKLIFEIAAAVVCIAIVFSVSAYAGYIFMPERTSFGALWNMFKNEEEDSIDIIYTGSSLAYCDIIPSVIYDNTGYTSYVLAGPEMTFPISYYYLKEAFKKQSPGVVMLEATGIFFKKYQDYSKVNIGYLPYNANRIEAAFKASEKEERLGLVFPLYNYHSCWETASFSSLTSKRTDDKIDISAGYTYLTDAVEQPERSVREQEFVKSDFDYNCGYLKKIKALCEKHGAELILFFVPSAQYPSAELMEKFFSNAEGIRVVDYNEQALFDTVGIDMQTDYYDFLHFNIRGARKFSTVFADWISENVSVPKHSHSDELWNERITYSSGLSE